MSSIRARLITAAALVLVAFMAATGWALQSAHEDSVLAARYARLQGTVYLVLAGAEVDADGRLQMPREFAEPRLSLPGSGLYASVLHVPSGRAWESASAVGMSPPFRHEAQVGQWRYGQVGSGSGTFLSASYGVSWAGPAGGVPLVLSVLESRASFDRESSAFRRTLWAWLGAAGALLLLSQTLLLQWGLAPLRRVSQEIERIERGEQAAVEGDYPDEIAGLTGNLNTLIRQERVRQTRYKEALSFLAHSLKTPLAVLRSGLGQPDSLHSTVEQQVLRMDHIVAHQLGRAAASGAARFAPYLELAPVAARIRDALVKVHGERNLQFDIECLAGLRWRMDEGDAFELLGNLMDNAAKWARTRVAVRIWQEGFSLRVRVDDDGSGFASTEDILALHVRGDEQVPGHGVGLAVVNEFVASHGGQVQLGRSEEGGARVDLTLHAA